MNLENLSNDDLLSGLHSLVGQGRVVLARLLAYLGEVEERRLDLESACSSLFDFCTRRLGMSEDEAFRRVAGARLVRQFPVALGMIERGELHLTALLLLREHLTRDNHEEVLRAAAHKTKGEVLSLLAERFPRADAPARVQLLPVAPAGTLQGIPGAANTSPEATGARPPLVEPLSPQRYKVQFTASAELMRKIDRATNRMRHKNPSGDLALVLDRALDLLLAQLEKHRLGKTTRPSTKAPRKSTRPGYVPRAVRREVFARDGEQCGFVDQAGRRCPSKAFLELDHRNARALGGTDTADNLRVVCRRHNGLHAERVFGRDHIESKKDQRKNHTRQRGSDSANASLRAASSKSVPDSMPSILASLLRALCGMGFKVGEARRALASVEDRWTDSPPPIETLLREALSELA